MKMKMFKKGIIVLLFSLLVINVSANVKPANVFNNHMVLQRNVKVPVWGTANAGEKVIIEFNKQKLTTIANSKGQWRVNLAKLTAGGPYTMLIKGNNVLSLSDIYVGDVWICSGQSNMDMTVAKEDRYWCGVYNEAEEVASADYPLIRVFDTDFTPSALPLADVVGKWEVVSPKTVGHLSAVAYFFARNVQNKIKVPIGLITTAFGASTAEAWVREEALVKEPSCKPLVDSFKQKLVRYESDTIAKNKYIADKKKWIIDSANAKAEGKNPPRNPRNPDPVRDQHNASVLWNGMTQPLVPYAIKGALWYQGESNSPTANIYRIIMETLIKDWRAQWAQGDFPFLYVQLANNGPTYDSLPAKGGTEAIKREAQLQNLSLPNTAMAVAIDNADSADMNNIHPKNKQQIGDRLALAALATVYNQKIVYSGPVYSKMEIKENSIILYFTNTGGGLWLKPTALKTFAIAGADKKFVWANAVVNGETVVVSSPDISNPVSVRYAWGKNPPSNLYNKENLPASPFRTDVNDK